MKKIVLAVVTALVLGFGMSGCGLKQLKQQEKNICDEFLAMDLANIKDGGNIKNISLDNVKYNGWGLFNGWEIFYEAKIINYDSGIVMVKWNNYRWNNYETRELHCPKLKVLDTTKETKSFTVNGGGSNDFSVKITKEAHITQLVKEGEVIKTDIIIPSYTPEKISVVEYKYYVYKADSPYIKKMRNSYAKIEQTFRNNLPCFEMNRKRYCDSDLVQVLGSNVMLRVVESGYGTVNYKVYFYNGKQPTAEVSYEFYNYFRMDPPEVIGNHDLKKDEVPSARDLKLIDIRTFKEW